MTAITRILQSLEVGDPAAMGQLLPIVYDELRLLARGHMAREGQGHTLQATALVHEACLRLMGSGNGAFDSRRHFFGAASEAMRCILVEHARRKTAAKRGGRAARVPLDDDLPEIDSQGRDPAELLAVHEGLDLLEKELPSMATLVKLSFFGGLTLDEAADVLGISRATAYRHWTFARAWLHEKCGGS